MKSKETTTFILFFFVFGCSTSDLIKDEKSRNEIEIQDMTNSTIFKNSYKTDSLNYQDLTKYHKTEYLYLENVSGNVCELCHLIELKSLHIYDSLISLQQCDSNCFKSLELLYTKLLVDTIFPNAIYGANKLESLTMKFKNEKSLPDINTLYSNTQLQGLEFTMVEKIQDSTFLSSYFKNLIDTFSNINTFGFVHRNKNLDFHVDFSKNTKIKSLCLSDNIFDEKRFTSLNSLRKLKTLELVFYLDYNDIEIFDNFKRLKVLFISIKNCDEDEKYYQALKKVLPKKTEIMIHCGESAIDYWWNM